MSAASEIRPLPFLNRAFPLLSAIFAAATLLSLAAQRPTQAQTNAPAGVSVGRNVKARDFTDTFGVNVHFNQNNYKNAQAVADALHAIGFSRVRSSCADPADVSAWKALAAKVSADFPSGLKADVLITGYLNAPQSTFAEQQALIPQIAGLIESIEGPNEINNRAVGNGTHGPTDTTDRTDHWSADYAAWAEAIYDWRQNTPSLSRVKLFAPSIASGDPADYARLPDVSPYVTAGNLHFYAGNGRQPSGFGGGNFAVLSDWYKAAATPDRPVVMSEWGQTTGGKTGQGGCNPNTQAKYILNQMFDAAAKGVYRAYLYQLMDDTPDGDPTGGDGTEAHFGIFDYKWNAKPAAQALATIKTLLADTTTDFTATIPPYSVRGLTDAGAAGSRLSISKSDGSTFLVVWNEPQIWDAGANAVVMPPPDRVTVTFGGPYSYQVYDPLTGLRPIAVGSGSSTGVDVTGSPILIHLMSPHHSHPKLSPKRKPQRVIWGRSGIR